MERTKTTFDQLHGRMDSVPESERRLMIDLDICSSEQCPECVIKCTYFYHPVNNGMISLIELATYALVCRQCEEPHCVNSCPREALEKLEDGTLVRHTVRCVSCRSCSHSCPYGTIYPGIVPHLTNICDYCQTRGEYECVPTCPYGALSVVEGEVEGENVFTLGKRLVVHSTHWDRSRV